jgi:hypothetical protein
MDVASQLVRGYQKEIIRIERQHQAQLQKVNGNMKHLESQLRRYKVETVPPVVSSSLALSKAEVARALVALVKKKSFLEQRQKSRRESAATAAISSCLQKSYYSPNKDRNNRQRFFFTLASGIVGVNQFFPAMLAAIASTNGV